MELHLTLKKTKKKNVFIGLHVTATTYYFAIVSKYLSMILNIEHMSKYRN